MQDLHILDLPDSFFVDGVWREPSSDRILQIADPSTGGPLGRIRLCAPTDVDLAAVAAARAFPAWAQTPSVVRADHLRGFAAGLRRHGDALIALMMRNGGKPRPEAEIDLGDAIATFDYYAGLADELDNRQDQPVHHAGGLHIGRVRSEPIGPVGLIVPWNFPLVTSAWKIAPALAAGCTVVLKTSEITPFLELAYARIALEIGLPPGVFNLVTGTADVGMAMTASRHFRKVSFTGSNQIGARVMQAVADRCLPVALELGGKSPIVVTADCDLALAVECIAGGIFYNAGQMCSATSRLIVERSIEPQLIEALRVRAENIRPGSPSEAGTGMGPITHRAQFDRVASFLEVAARDELDCIAGGRIAAGDGYFVPPTIYRNVPRDNAVWREEIFGPVLATTTFETDDEAIEKANDSEYALAASVVCGTSSRTKWFADRILAGQIWVNTPQIVYPDSAWGGFKASGVGRELGPWGLSSFLGVKHVTAPFSGNPT